MAKSKTVWQSDDGKQYDTEVEAVRADARYEASLALSNAWTGHGIELKKLESLNEDHLKPICEYFNGLMLAAIERTKKHG
jgi:hypothetical protein